MFDKCYCNNVAFSESVLPKFMSNFLRGAETDLYFSSCLVYL